ncbi:MAG: NAD-dependent epimerase/dehydratase family protein [Candidatus Moraniibacteriota bacterium]
MHGQYDSILVGGSGFVGTRLGVHLAGKGERVLSLSRHQPEKPMRGVEFAKIDFGNQEEVASFILPRTDSLVILIGQIGPGFDPEADRRALQMVIDLANAQASPMKVLYCSTALVYGDCETPARESDSPRPIEPYAKHKLENEAFLRECLAVQHHLGILRLANVFGELRSRGFVSLVMNRLLVSSLEAFRINGDGNQRRDYIFVDNLVEAIAAVKAGLNGQDTVNISSGESRTLLSVIDSIQSVCGKKFPFEITHQPMEEAKNILVSNEHLREVYGYAPQLAFNGSLARMWQQALAKKTSLDTH